MGPVYQAGTLSGNPVAVSAGLATLEALQDRMAEDEGANANPLLVKDLPQYVYGWPSQKEEKRGTQITVVNDEAEDVLAPLTALYKSPEFSVGFLHTRQTVLWGLCVTEGGNLLFQPFSADQALGIQILNLGTGTGALATWGSGFLWGDGTLWGQGASEIRGVQPFALVLPLEAEGINFSTEFLYVGDRAFELHRFGWGVTEVEPEPRIGIEDGDEPLQFWFGLSHAF